MGKPSPAITTKTKGVEPTVPDVLGSFCWKCYPVS